MAVIHAGQAVANSIELIRYLAALDLSLSGSSLDPGPLVRSQLLVERHSLHTTLG